MLAKCFTCMRPLSACACNLPVPVRAAAAPDAAAVSPVMDRAAALYALYAPDSAEAKAGRARAELDTHATHRRNMDVEALSAFCAASFALDNGRLL